MTETILINDVEYCKACTAGKVNSDLSCNAYSKMGQAQWMRRGWCPLGLAGPHPPKGHAQKEKVRAGQQKQSGKH